MSGGLKTQFSGFSKQVPSSGVNKTKITPTIFSMKENELFIVTAQSMGKPKILRKIAKRGLTIFFFFLTANKSAVWVFSVETGSQSVIIITIIKIIVRVNLTPVLFMTFNGCFHLQFICGCERHQEIVSIPFSWLISRPNNIGYTLPRLFYSISFSLSLSDKMKMQLESAPV